MINAIYENLPRDCTWKDSLHWFETIDSTNTRAKEMAADGAPHGTVLIAGQQTAGRGRLGRSFHSAPGKGLYLSVILRPQCKPEQLMHLTCAAALTTCDAIEAATHFIPKIKWINDIVAGKKKLGGILTELSIDSKTGLVQYAVIGIGINCSHITEDFPEALQGIATSLLLETGKVPDMAALAAFLICAFWQMNEVLLSENDAMMARYKKYCITLNRQVVVINGDTKRYGKAIDIDNTGSLCIECEDGTTQWVCSGEVSVRGMYGYI